MNETLVSIDGTRVRVVRLRHKSFPMGGFSLGMWIVTDPHGRKQLGPTHFSRHLAARWATAQGWRYIGAQEPTE